MLQQDWLSTASIIVSLGIPAVLFVCRRWIAAWIAGDVQHRFNLKIEDVRAEFRKAEEQLKSDLRDREAEISTLRNSVLAGSAGRRALLDKRRFEAVERIWTAVNDMAGYKTVSGFMAHLNYKALARSKDANLQQFIATISAAAPQPKDFKNVARDEQPFVPELVWAYFSAYSSIVLGSYIQLLLLQTGVSRPDELLDKKGIQKILKVTLPQFSEFIEKNEPETYYFMIEHIEQLLLSELRKALEGKDADQADTARAKEINNAVNEARANVSG